jgi:hypothetical protein
MSTVPEIEGYFTMRLSIFVLPFRCAGWWLQKEHSFVLQFCCVFLHSISIRPEQSRIRDVLMKRLRLPTNITWRCAWFWRGHRKETQNFDRLKKTRGHVMRLLRCLSSCWVIAGSSPAAVIIPFCSVNCPLHWSICLFTFLLIVVQTSIRKT